MAEPSSSTAAGIVIATGTITLTGSFIGLQYDALLFGLFGGMVSLMFLPPDTPTLRTKRSTAGMLIVAAILGGLFAPGVVGAAHLLGEWVSKIPGDSIRLPAAAVIGLTYQLLIPLGMKLLRERAGV